VNAIKFVDYVLSKSPLQIHTARTDNGNEFQEKFHWHLTDLGIYDIYIKPRTPRLNGKIERSHGTDETEIFSVAELRKRCISESEVDTVGRLL